LYQVLIMGYSVMPRAIRNATTAIQMVITFFFVEIPPF